MGLKLRPEDLRFLFTEPFSFVLDDYFLAHAEVNPAALTLEETEVVSARWIGLEEIKSMIEAGTFVDYPLAGLEKVFLAAAEVY